MVKLSSFQRIKNIEFKWPDSEETLNLVVHPDELTGHNLETLEYAIKTAADSDAEAVAQHRFLCEFLSSIVYSWDLTDDDGKAIDTKPETIFQLIPVTLVSALLETIQRNMKVDPLKPES